MVRSKINCIVEFSTERDEVWYDIDAVLSEDPQITLTLRILFSLFDFFSWAQSSDHDETEWIPEADQSDDYLFFFI